MTRFINLLRCLLAFAGLVYGAKLMNEGTRPCGSDGCMIHLLVPAAIIFFLISGLVFYISVKREIKYFKNK
jgi:hypothetical protein